MLVSLMMDLGHVFSSISRLQGGGVSDDECPRYCFSFFLGSTSRLALLLIASSFAWYCTLLLFMCFFSRKECYLRYHSFSLFLLYMCMLFWLGVSPPVFCFSCSLFSFRIHSYSAVSLSLCRQGFDLFTERAHILVP
jgi:hypothetical protein